MTLRERLNRLERLKPRCKGKPTKLVFNDPDYVPVEEDRCPGCGEPHILHITEEIVGEECDEPPLPGVVDQDSPHRLSGHAEEWPRSAN